VIREREGGPELVVHLRLFALARERAGKAEVVLELPERANVAHLRHALGEAYPSLRPLLPHLMIAVNAEYADERTLIPPGAELAAIPPVSGGA
jgi:molybdopterin converting factor subunit 1